MKLIVGLGNPGRRYAKTRHNLGYRTVDQLAERWHVAIEQENFSGRVGRASYAGHDVLLLKPTTFMNLSGESVQAALQFYKLPLDAVLIVMDDLDLPIGRVRIRGRGSAGGHKGLADILQRLGSDEVARVRIGIGSADRDRTIDHVLSPADEDQTALLDQGVMMAADAVMCWLREGLESTMNTFNGLPASPQQEQPPERMAELGEEPSEETSR
jgi:PTH1 family peptidyl-tRNA hydrolase